MSDIVRMLRAELAATRELEMKACKEVDRLNAELAAANARHSAPPYVFRRFKGGNEMAEGLIIKNAETLEHAIAKAAWFYPGTGTVFVIEDVDARKERDEARAELAAERKKNKLTKLRFQQAQQMIKHLSQRSSTGSERPPSKREVEGSSPSVEATFRDELAAERERNAAPSEYDLALLAERDALRAALREIAVVQYGLQGIIDECGGDRNKENYFVRKYFGDEVSRYQQIARAALNKGGGDD